jgi:hypothetical protein
MKFLNTQPLSEDELLLLKNYVIGWIDALSNLPSFLPPDYKEKIQPMNQEMFEDYCEGELLDYAIDPF